MIKKDNFRPIPFYFINDTVEREEIDRQMTLMKQSGVSGFFLHARCGLTEYGYGNKRWYEDIDYIIRKAAECGLETWLYDEDSYPSGNAGGRITMEHPEFVAWELHVEKVENRNGENKIILPPCRPLKAYSVTDDNPENYCDLTDCFGIIRQNWYGMEIDSPYYEDQKGFKHKRSATYNPKIIFSTEAKKNESVYVVYAKKIYTINRFGSLTDNLNKKCVDLFKKNTYSAYKSNLSEDALKNVRGIFTDEPAAGLFFPWTESLHAFFYKEKGYRLEDNYYYLVGEYGEKSEIVRRDYWQITAKMFNENYLKNLAVCSKKLGFRFVGHLECEDSLFYQIKKGINVYDGLWNFDIPGCDLLCGQIGTRNSPSLSFGTRLATSVARQKGVNKTFCEMFAVNPFNFGDGGMKKVMNWAFVLGINVCIPHGFYYGYAGMRKYDAGKSFFFQDSQFDKFSGFSDYVSRIGQLTANSPRNAKVLLVYPDWEIAACLFSNEEKALQIQSDIFAAVAALSENHVEFDLADCNRVVSEFSDGKARIGKVEYDYVVYLSERNSIFREVEERIVGCSSQSFKFEGNNGDFSKWLNERRLCVPIEGINCDGKDIIVSVRKGLDGEVLLLYNTSKTFADIYIDYFSEKKNSYVYDGETDRNFILPVNQGKVRIAIEGFGLTIVRYSHKKCAESGEYELKSYPDRLFEFEENPQCVYVPPVTVCSTVSEYDVTVKYGEKVEDFKRKPFALLRDLYSANSFQTFQKTLRPVYDGTVPPDKTYPVYAEFRSTFDGSDAEFMLFETETFCGNCEVLLNGVKLDIKNAPKKIIYDFRNRICSVKSILKDKNEIIVRFESAEEYDGINSEIYFI